MNIFFTSYDPIQAANWLDKKRKNKMITESVQMLSTATWFRFYQDEYPYDKWFSRKIPKHIREENKIRFKDETGLMIPCYINHPSNIWVRKSTANYQWLLTHVNTLGFGKKHKALNKIKYCMEPIGIDVVEHITPLPNCTPFCKMNGNARAYFTESDSDVILAYRKFMKQKWFETDKRNPIWDEYPYWAFIDELPVNKDYSTLLIKERNAA